MKLLVTRRCLLGAAALALFAPTPTLAQISIDQAMRAPFIFAQAAREGNYWYVRNSLISGVSPNSRDPEQRPAIVLAAMNGHLQIVELLCQHSVLVNASDAQRNTALSIAAGRGHLEIVEVLMRSRANINAANNVGETPLFLAAKNGHARVVEALIRGGADLNQSDFTGRTPLAAAERSNSPNRRAVVEALTRVNARR